MDELKRYIADFNYIVGRINKAESISAEKLNQYSEDGYMKLITALQEIIRQSSDIGNKIERLINRPLTDYECLHGINI